MAAAFAKLQDKRRVESVGIKKEVRLLFYCPVATGIKNVSPTCINVLVLLSCFLGNSLRPGSGRKKPVARLSEFVKIKRFLPRLS
jgi:hypothetical protein